MPSDVTPHPNANDQACLANHQRRITATVVRHGACQTAMHHVESRCPGRIDLSTSSGVSVRRPGQMIRPGGPLRSVESRTHTHAELSSGRRRGREVEVVDLSLAYSFINYCSSQGLTYHLASPLPRERHEYAAHPLSQLVTTESAHPRRNVARHGQQRNLLSTTYPFGSHPQSRQDAHLPRKSHAHPGEHVP